MRRTIALATFLIGLAAPAPAFGLRYASPTGVPANNCQTVATACDLRTAIEGDGAANLPVNGEEIVVQPGSYAIAAQLDAGLAASNLNIHGAAGQPRPVINGTGFGRVLVSGGTLSHLQFEKSGSSEAINLSGGTLERVFMRGTSSIPVCQCYGGLVRDSVFISTGTEAALGAFSAGGSATMTYRNVTAYAANPAAPVIEVQQQDMSGTLNFTIYNSVALHGGGGTEVDADGPNTTITFSHSNYRTTDLSDGGVIQDAVGGAHQGAPPLFTNAAAADFSQVSGSPTIDAGVTDPLNGPLDYAGNPRVSGSSTDIGALELQVPSAPGNPGGTKCKKKKKGKKKAASPAAKKKKKKGCKKKKRKKK